MILGPLPVDNSAVMSATDQDSKTAAIGLAALEIMGLIVNFPVGNCNGWVLTEKARQLALPIGLGGDEEAKRKFSALLPHVVVVKESSNDLIDSSINNNNIDTLNGKFPLSFMENRIRALLSRLDCWPNVADLVLEALHPDKGLAHLLGWIAFAHDPQNNIRRPVSLVTANLRAGQPPTTLYTPVRICSGCHRAEHLCGCPEPAPDYPEDFDDLAFQSPDDSGWGREAWLQDRWFCKTCGAHPCQCVFEED
jgi:hypothetical protein